MKAAPTTELETRARELYLRASPPIDSATAARLRAARRDALDAGTAPHRNLRWMVPTGAFAVVALAVAVVWQPMRSPASLQQVSASSLGDDELPPDAANADPALYQNLDFYAWLAQQPPAKRPRGG